MQCTCRCYLKQYNNIKKRGNVLVFQLNLQKHFIRPILLNILQVEMHSHIQVSTLEISCALKFVIQMLLFYNNLKLINETLKFYSVMYFRNPIDGIPLPTVDRTEKLIVICGIGRPQLG